jgi:hypothetical protein
MRYIDYSSFSPSEDWLEKSKKVIDALESKVSHTERLAFIDANAAVWRDLRRELITKYGCRCWFTDAEETVAQLDIEHFRPKAKAVDVDGTQHDGYWWLAFDHSNYRLAGQIPNRQHKKCYFPLLPGSPRADAALRRWQEENPVFLDPTRRGDVQLVAYNESGQVCPSPSAETAEEIMRVETTDRLLGLSDHQPLVEARQQVWSDCCGIMNEIERLRAEERAFNGSTARTSGEREQLMKGLAKMVSSRSSFASVARSCVMMSGHPWAQPFLNLD